MPSSPTTLLNLELINPGEQLNTWGSSLNSVISRATEAIAQLTTVPVTSPTTTLTATNYVANQARSAGLLLTGALTAATNIVAPSQTKIYLISNATTGAFALTINTVAGTPLALRNGSIPYWVYCDGTNFVTLDLTLDQIRTAAANIAMNTHKFTGMLKGSVTGDSASLDNAISDFLGAVAANVAMGGFTFTGLPAATAGAQPVTFGNRLDQLQAATSPISAPNAAAALNVVNLQQMSAAIAAAGITAPGTVRVSVTDTTPGFLGAKVLVNGLAPTIINAAANEQISVTTLDPFYQVATYQ